MVAAPKRAKKLAAFFTAPLVLVLVEDEDDEEEEPLSEAVAEVFELK